MKKVIIHRTPYEIDCDLGSQDICWLAMSACYMHGQHTYPVSRFVPCMARNKDGEILHPKLVICNYPKKIGDEIYVEVRNKASDPIDGEMNQDQSLWWKQAFGELRFFMNVKIRLLPNTEMRTKDISNLSININFKIHPPFLMFFPDQKENFSIELEEVGPKGKMESFMKTLTLPYGALEVNKVVFLDINQVEREVQGCKVAIEKFPEPVVSADGETLIKEKEGLIRNRENTIRQNIVNIEKEKKEEEMRINKLHEFLQSLPYSLDDIFEYANKEIPDSTKELISIFAHIEKDEYKIFKKLHEIFTDYCKFYDDNSDSTIDIEALMSFYKNYFDYSKEDQTIYGDFQKYYIDRSIHIDSYNFLDFIFALIFQMHKIQNIKMLSVEPEFNYIYNSHQLKMNDPNLVTVYKDDFVIGVLVSNIDYLKKLFNKFSKFKFENYYEMPPSQFVLFAKELASKKGYDYLTMTDQMKFLDDCCFFDFLEKLVVIANRVSSDPDLELSLKLNQFVRTLIEVFEEDDVGEKEITDKMDKTVEN